MAEARTSQRWLFGPAADLLLGCGLGYMLLVVAFLLVGTERQTIGALGLVALVSIFTGTPHYGATLLRVYEQRSERRAYAFFAVWATAALWAVFYLGLYSSLIGSLLLTAYLSWSPWHYSGQNYGIAVLFLRRRGVEIVPIAKRMLYASYLFSFLLTFLALHGSRGGGEYAAVQPYKGGSFHFMSLGIPTPYWDIAFVGVGLVYLASLVGSIALLLRRASIRDLTPVAVLALTQMMWFSIPATAQHWGLLGPDSLLQSNKAAYAFIWIAAGHSIQYLWVTTYYAAASQPAGKRFLYLGKTMAAGSFIWSVPALIYGLTVEGGPLGGVAQDQDVFVLLASAVNLHHFILDGAIWKLRDGRVARILIRRDAPPPSAAPIEPKAGGRRWLAALVYTIGIATTIQGLGAYAIRQFELEPALERGEMGEAYTAMKKLSWFRGDSAHDYLRFGNAAAAGGDTRQALRAYAHSVEKRPLPVTYVQIGRLVQQRGDDLAAIAAYEQAVALNPRDVTALNLIGLTWLKLGEPDRALDVLERALAVLPDNEVLRASFERARLRSTVGEADSP